MIGNKRESEGYGNPEFFTLGDDIDDQRIRRDSVVKYFGTTDQKEGYKIKVLVSTGDSISFTSPDKDIIKRTLAKLDKLFNVNKI